MGKDKDKKDKGKGDGGGGTATLNRGTLEELRSRTAARRDEWRERDADRLRLADELAAEARFTIPAERGYLKLPPGTIPEAQPVIETGNALIESIGHDRILSEFNPRKDTMSRGFLPPDAKELGSPYMNFALHRDVAAAASAYLGVVPILLDIDIWYAYAEHTIDAPINASLWHLDGDDTTQVKVWIHLADVVPESGPLTILDASRSEEFAHHTEYDSSVEYRIPDDKINSFITDDDFVTFDGPQGQVDFVDTSRAMHMGSRAKAGCPVRRVFFVKYVTPYAFKWKVDHREESPFRHLATDASSELETLLLGAK
jgi:hypothetical protein